MCSSGYENIWDAKGLHVYFKQLYVFITSCCYTWLILIQFLSKTILQLWKIGHFAGGTVDTTGHEVLKDGTLKELHAATGGPWGGQLVNVAFEKFIESMVT